MRGVLIWNAPLLLVASTVAANFTLVEEFSGETFFDKWDFYGDLNSGVKGPWNGVNPWDDTTGGDVFYMGKQNGSSLYHVDPVTGHAFIKVDNITVVPYDQKRKSIRMASHDFFNYGTVWVIDAYHLPWGCSVWPGIWTSGIDWPNTGEIDIIEGINRATANQMTLHTTPNCTAASGTNQTGNPGPTDCSSGCSVTEKQPNSYGPSFAASGGGVWAAHFDVSGIFIWFWSRPNVPPSITTATNSIDISSWGAPSAAFPASSCDITQHFGPQQLVIDITLCGIEAGDDANYNATCNDTPPQTAQRCYIDNVINNGTADYAMAYFELGAIRAFTSNTTDPTPTPASVTPGATTSRSASSTSSAPGSSETGGSSTGDGLTIPPNLIGSLSASFSLIFWTLVL